MCLNEPNAKMNMFSRMTMLVLLGTVIAVVNISGCVNASRHHKNLASSKEAKLTLGTVQRSIREGMPQSDVIGVMGSPNLVTRDQDGAETWVYDKVSTDSSYSSSSKGVRGLIAGGGNSAEGAISSDYAKQAGASSSTQRTLTVIIKFVGGLVSEYSYQSSSF